MTPNPSIFNSHDSLRLFSPAALDDEEHPEHPICFDACWDEMEACDAKEKRLAEERGRDLACKWLAKLGIALARFLVEDGRSRVEGAGIRAYVFASFFLGRLRSLTQPQLAQLMNRKHKQSIGREMTKFRDLFGEIGIIRPGMQRESARASCRRREAAKKVAIRFEEETAFKVEIDFQI